MQPLLIRLAIHDLRSSVDKQKQFESIYLFMYLSIHIYISIHLSVYSYIYISIHLVIFLSIYLSIYQIFNHLFIILYYIFIICVCTYFCFCLHSAKKCIVYILETKKEHVKSYYFNIFIHPSFIISFYVFNYSPNQKNVPNPADLYL